MCPARSWPRSRRCCKLNCRIVSVPGPGVGKTGAVPAVLFCVQNQTIFLIIPSAVSVSIVLSICHFVLAKMQGISGKLLSVIGNWLSNRKQRVCIKGRWSKWITVWSGVPQGSVLGPVIFDIYKRFG